MAPPRPDRIQQLFDQLYQHFDSHPHAKDFCSFCWSDEEVDYINTCPVRELSLDMAEKLLWEASDHWPNVEVYQYYLPRILEALAPPEAIDDLYPLHLFEVLKYHDFHSWQEDGKQLVRQLCSALTATFTFELEEDYHEWESGLRFLNDPHFNLPIDNGES